MELLEAERVIGRERLKKLGEKPAKPIPEESIQLVERFKPRHLIYPRAIPRTAQAPTDGQIRARIAFGEAAKRAKGRALIEEPPAATAVRKQMEGKSYGRMRKKKRWEEVLEALIR